MCASQGDTGTGIFGGWSDGPSVIGTETFEDSDFVYGPGGAGIPNLINYARATWT